MAPLLSLSLYLSLSLSLSLSLTSIYIYISLSFKKGINVEFIDAPLIILFHMNVSISSSSYGRLSAFKV